MKTETKPKNSPKTNETKNGEARRSSSQESIDIVGSLIEFFKQHPAIIGTLLYVQASVVGLIYSWVLYSKFNINIFDFAEVNDFLTFAFKQPLAYGTSLFTAVIFIVEVALLRWMRFVKGRKFRTKPIVFWFAVTTVILYTLFLPVAFGRLDARKLKENPRPKVMIELKDSKDQQSIISKDSIFCFLGTTDKFALFYYCDKDQPIAITVNNIVAMKFVKNDKELCHDKEE